MANSNENKPASSPPSAPAQPPPLPPPDLDLFEIVAKDDHGQTPGEPLKK